MSTPPQLPAYPRTDDTGGLRVWCDHCHQWHLHGAGYGHRVAHCHSDSPYKTGGYELIPPSRPPQ